MHHLLSDDPLIQKDNFSQCEKSSFQDYVISILREVTQFSDMQHLTTKEYHNLRKKLRLLMNLFQVPATKNLSGVEHQLFLQLYQLSTELGEKHDEIVQKGLVGDLDYHQQEFILDTQMQSKISAVLERISYVLGIERVAV